jgi:hypothetical protein
MLNLNLIPKLGGYLALISLFNLAPDQVQASPFRQEMPLDRKIYFFWAIEIIILDATSLKEADYLLLLAPEISKESDNIAALKESESAANLDITGSVSLTKRDLKTETKEKVVVVGQSHESKNVGRNDTELIHPGTNEVGAQNSTSASSSYEIVLKKDLLSVDGPTPSHIPAAAAPVNNHNKTSPQTAASQVNRSNQLSEQSIHSETLAVKSASMTDGTVETISSPDALSLVSLSTTAEYTTQTAASEPSRPSNSATLDTLSSPHLFVHTYQPEIHLLTLHSISATLKADANTEISETPALLANNVENEAFSHTYRANPSLLSHIDEVTSALEATGSIKYPNLVLGGVRTTLEPNRIAQGGNGANAILLAGIGGLIGTITLHHSKSIYQLFYSRTGRRCRYSLHQAYASESTTQPNR